jgi:hypothetical protein
MNASLIEQKLRNRNKLTRKKGVNMDIKWTAVFLELKKSPELFQSLIMTSKALQNKCLKNEKEVFDKFGITKQTFQMMSFLPGNLSFKSLHW